ncbi:hypothetical protein NEOLEDRAFT_1174457 [Neolentinus lepideus HHB14362 ss-1]|uniref:Uncharacterized protein n=1 Tax=Neolentinus lepideus HHB14362 ss-1 TaxID=1314782 RepID=A0A165VSP2_9AGAM|nr:hypothetical protein NEOLEDRAFT_1174457 [Neolentinus lepideus HHB14362 ss-1]
MALFLIEMTFVTFLSARYAKTETLTFGNATICNNALSWSLVPAIVFDTIMGSVIIYRAVLHVKTSRQMDIPASWGYGGRLLTTLMRDSIQYYMWYVIHTLESLAPIPQNVYLNLSSILLVFLLVALSNLMTDALANIQPFLIPWIMIVPTSSATSMILHLHQVSSQDRCSIIDFDPDSPVELDTSIRFVHTASRNGLTPEVEA